MVTMRKNEKRFRRGCFVNARSRVVSGISKRDVTLPLAQTGHASASNFGLLGSPQTDVSQDEKTGNSSKIFVRFGVDCNGRRSRLSPVMNVSTLHKSFQVKTLPIGPVSRSGRFSDAHAMHVMSSISSCLLCQRIQGTGGIGR